MSIAMLFLRDFHGLTGGHLKHRDYLLHTRASGRVEPRLFLTPSSARSPENPFLDADVARVDVLAPAESYFVAGLDWALLDAAGIDTRGRPVVNLIQGLSHARPDDPK